MSTFLRAVLGYDVKLLQAMYPVTSNLTDAVLEEIGKINQCFTGLTFPLFIPFTAHYPAICALIPVFFLFSVLSDFCLMRISGIPYHGTFHCGYRHISWPFPKVLGLVAQIPCWRDEKYGSTHLN
jgi:hypothetical protein